MRQLAVLFVFSVVTGSRLTGNHVTGNHVTGKHATGPLRTSFERQGRQVQVPGGIDFSNAELDPETGKKCILKEIEVDTLDKQPILECTHKNVEKCHYTYVTKFSPTQEEICDENFEKKCRITFKQQAVNETVKKCYKPVEKVCNGEGPEECRTIFESSCTTKYVEKQPGKFVGDSQCEKLPIKICGAGCIYQEGEEECHDKVIVSVVDTPEEVCDLNPQKICRFTTKLVPRLSPTHECTIVPKESCHLRFTNPQPAKKPLLTKWCLDETEPTPGESYDESNALGDPIRTPPSDSSQSASQNQPRPSCGPGTSGPNCTPVQPTPTCGPGTSGPNCTPTCGPGTSGPNCTPTCGPGTSGPSCTPTCGPGTSGPNCTPTCGPGTSGPNCTPTCGPGTSGPSCTPTCGPGTSGPNCTPTCGPGTSGPNCTPTCGPGTSGPNCTPTCGPGTSGPNCTPTCGPGTSGPNCTPIQPVPNCGPGQTGPGCAPVTPECGPGQKGPNCAPSQGCEFGQSGPGCDEYGGLPVPIPVNTEAPTFPTFNTEAPTFNTEAPTFNTQAPIINIVDELPAPQAPQSFYGAPLADYSDYDDNFANNIALPLPSAPQSQYGSRVRRRGHFQQNGRFHQRGRVQQNGRIQQKGKTKKNLSYRHF